MAERPSRRGGCSSALLHGTSEEHRMKIKNREERELLPKAKEIFQWKNKKISRLAWKI
jgi:hypothetical protein